ncbi:MAG: histidine phosphotransferase [Sphingobium sp. 32-64-5]|nr:MAG: histidine phosphotransferase [Sphingobium sp. 32-64-5]
MTKDEDQALDFAALLCSRLCHDLLSPVGAFNNGLELMADETDPEMRQRCLDLLAESARASANKLKFFRLAFGSAGGFGDMVPTDEARQAIEGMFAASGRVRIGWLVGPGMLAKGAVKILLNLALIVLDEELRAALAGTLREEALSSRNAAAWMTHRLAARAGGQILLSPPGDPALVFGAFLPG